MPPRLPISSRLIGSRHALSNTVGGVRSGGRER